MNQCIDHGKKGNKAGYRSVYVGGGKANPKYDLAHRVALAKELGRALLPGEQTELARLFGVSHQLISLIVRRKLWA